VGFVGIVIVIGDRGIGFAGIDAVGLILCVVSLFAIAIGTIYQKRHCTHYDLLPGVCIQYIATAGFLMIMAFSLETREVDWSARFITALTWLVLVLSIGAVLLLMWLIRHGEAGKIASLFYLVPPFVTVEAWLLFDEKLSLTAIGGIALCVCGVAIVINTESRSPA
ncbi:MAG: DMT family transporter, partial [bacterium]